MSYSTFLVGFTAHNGSKEARPENYLIDYTIGFIIIN